VEFLLSALSGVSVRPLSLELGFEDDTTEMEDGRTGVGLGDRKENKVGVDERNLLLARSLLPSLLEVLFVLGKEGPPALTRLISGVRARELSGVLERPGLLATEFERLLAVVGEH